jgi:hypothetical protein
MSTDVLLIIIKEQFPRRVGELLTNNVGICLTLLNVLICFVQNERYYLIKLAPTALMKKKKLIGCYIPQRQLKSIISI